MKRGILGLILGIFLISFVSAQFPGFNYGSYVDSSVIIWSAVFIIFFALLNFILGKTIFKNDRTTKAVISFAISVLATYGLIRSDFEISGGSIGNWYIGDFLTTAIPIIFLLGVIYFLYRYRKRIAEILMILGALFIIISFTNLVYEKNILLVLGIILLVIGIWAWMRRNKREREGGGEGERGGEGRGPSPEQPAQEEKIRREKRRRSISDLKQKYESYKFSIFRTNLTPHQRRRMLKAMKIIARQLKKLDSSHTGQSPKEIERTLRNRKQI